MMKRCFLFFIVLQLLACKSQTKLANNDSPIITSNIGNRIEDHQQIQSRTTTDPTSNRYYSNTGAEYLLFDSPLSEFNNGQADNVSVIKVNDKFAILQAKDVYLFSWFKKENESDDVTLQRAFDFIHYVRNDGKEPITGMEVSTRTKKPREISSSSGTILIDQNVILKNTVFIYENITLKGDFTASNDYNFRSNTLFLDINDPKKSGIQFKRFPGAPDPPFAYVSAKVENLRISALSPCRTAVSMDGASGEVMRNVMLSSNNYVENGFEMSFSIFCKVANVRVEKPKNYGFYYKATPDGIGTTTEIENLSINGGRIGIFVDYKSNNSLWLKNCVVEMTENSAIKIEQYNTVYVDNFYAENVPNDLIKKDTIGIIEINSKDFKVSQGNKGMITIKNSIINGYHKEIGTRKIVGIYADNVDVVNVTECSFSLVNNSIIMKSGCNSVNWFNNSEPGTMNVYKALNQGNPKDNGIENPNNFNVISSYSGTTGKYEPYTRLVSTKSRLHTPILLSQEYSRMRISEESPDENTRFTELWVQYGYQPGELRIAPGGKNVAATFGTNGGVTIGNPLTSAPPQDGLRVHGQGVFGSGSPSASAALQVESTDKGFLPPRLTTAQRDAITSPTAGLIIFNTSVNKHQGYNGMIWNDLY